MQIIEFLDGGASMKNGYATLIAVMFLLGCGEKPAEQNTAKEAIAGVGAEDAAPQNKFGFAEAVKGPDLFGNDTVAAMQSIVDASAGSDQQDGTPPSDQALPSQGQIAYSYGFGFRIDKEKIGPLQKMHIAKCVTMGPKCHVLYASQSSTDSDGYGELKLKVAANEAGAMERALAKPASQLGGELVSSVRDGEDLSDSIIDTQAKIQSRLMLREKLTNILKNNKGSVDQLIAAEKGVADVNEELDASRTKLAEYRTRIRYSDVRIEYQPQFGESQLGFSRPVATAARSIGTTLGMTLAALIYVTTALVPLLVFIVALRWLLHRFGLRIRFWRKKPKLAEPAP